MPSNEMILSFSHRPLSQKGIELLTNETKECFLLTEQRLKSEWIEEKQLQESTTPPNPVIHVLVTGTPYLYRGKAGRTLDWDDTQWTEGEKILGKIIDKIGLHKFHSIAKKGEVQVKGRLIDVKQSDFENVQKPEDRRKEELTWIANYIQNELILVQANQVKKAYFLYPVYSDLDNADYHQDDFNITIEDIFRKEWNKKDASPVKGVDIEIKLLRVEKEDMGSMFGSNSPIRKPIDLSTDPDETVGQLSLSGAFVRKTSFD